jgi:hypothetical protein
VEHRPLDAWLRIGVVVLDAVQQLAQAPVAVRFSPGCAQIQVATLKINPET